MARSFRTQKDFRDWLLKNHAKADELMLRLFKVHARAKGIGYKEALDEALCFGWIDGVRRSLDADSFTQRFTPRKKRSNWSRVNIKRVGELEAEGRMHSAGLAAFKARDTTKPAPYSSEAGKGIQLAPAYVAEIGRDRAAKAFWETLAPGYKHITTFWVMSAKRPETRDKRFAILLANARKGRRIPLLG